MLPYLLLAVLSGSAFAQTSAVRIWQEHDPCCRRSARDGVIEKRMSVDGIVVTASLVAGNDSIIARIRIENAGRHPLRLGTGAVTLVAGPGSNDLVPARTARDVAHEVRARASRTAAALDAQAVTATTVAHEQVPTTVNVPNPAAASDPTQPATIPTAQTETVVKIVPNEAERVRLHSEASTIRRRADREATKIVATELSAQVVPEGGEVTGARYFTRADGIRSVRLRILAESIAVDIPFIASRCDGDGWK